MMTDYHYCSSSNRVLFNMGLLVFTMFLTFNVVHSEENKLQEVLMVVGYDGDAWYPYIKLIEGRKNNQHSKWQKIEKVRNPTYLTRQPETGNLFVKGNDGKLYIYDSNNKSLALLPPIDKAELTNYTQLRASKDGVALVVLLEGKSRDTQLGYYNTHPGNVPSAEKLMTHLINQESAQFHPYKHGSTLYYAHVSCRTACKPVIQDVWRHDLVSGKTNQITMLNATSYLHSVDSQARYGFISSNKQGYYHIARLDLTDNSITWLTDGQVTDSYPSISQDGDLYFIRRTPGGTYLMKLENAGKTQTKPLSQIGLPAGVSRIRYLELAE